MTCRKGALAVIALITMLALPAWYWIVVYDNYHAVIENELYRSAQLSSRELRDYIARDRLATIINLRDDTNATWWTEEKTTCEQEGVMHIDIPLRGDRDPTIEQMRKLVATFRESQRPLLIHCMCGADRTSLAVALYLLTQGNERITPTSAFSATYGHLPMIFRSVKRFDNAYAQYKALVELNLTQLDEDGLRGPPAGKVAVAYEFCIPDTAACRKQVKAIDHTVQFMPGSRGRIGASKQACLCVGSTHQKHFRQVLKALAELPYIERIIECH